MTEDTLKIVYDVVMIRLERGYKNSNSFILPQVYMDLIENCIEKTEDLGATETRKKLLLIWMTQQKLMKGRA